MTDSVRMNTTASAAAGPMICANCHRGEQTNAMGWLKLGEMDTGGIRGGRTHRDAHTERDTRLPKFGALVRR
jgi:hypothetical protein